MNKIRLFAFQVITAAVFTLSASVGAQVGNSQSEKLSESEAMSAAQKWVEVVGQGDVAGLQDLLHEEYMHIHATALVESKGKFIEALKTGARKYDPIKIEESHVRVFDGSTVVTGKFVLRATTRERVLESVNRFSLLIVKTSRGIQVASFQATSVP